MTAPRRGVVLAVIVLAAMVLWFLLGAVAVALYARITQ